MVPDGSCTAAVRQLYGSDRDTIYDVIANGRLGECPPWGNTLDAATIKSLAVYIWNKSLGL